MEQLKKEVVRLLLKQKILVNKDILTKLNNPQALGQLHTTLKQGGNPIPLIQEKRNESDIQILKQYTKPPKKRKVQDFISIYNSRYKQLSKILRERTELQNLTSITRIHQKQYRESISVIGYVSDKRVTKNGNIMIKLEDDTGEINALINKDKEELYKTAKDLVEDEIIGITGTGGQGIIFLDAIIHPGIPHQELKKTGEEAYACIISDIHVGSKLFQQNEFNAFISWLEGNHGNAEQRAIADKTKYIFIVGDLVDGIGIYPNQQKELELTDIYAQYEKLSSYLDRIPKDKRIIIIPGNHDAVRLAEPQPKLSEDYASSIYDIKNTINLTNPSTVTIAKSKGFPGFNFLLYHGYSYDFYGENVESIRNSGKNVSSRVDLVMKYLLERRHLNPSHKAVPFIPDDENDPMVIEQIPDYFISGHIHKPAINNYRHVNIIASSCWQAQTEFQEKMGHEPEPCKVPIINLKTRKTTLLDFSK